MEVDSNLRRIAEIKLHEVILRLACEVDEQRGSKKGVEDNVVYSPLLLNNGNHV